jgi:hypothetical protein
MTLMVIQEDDFRYIRRRQFSYVHLSQKLVISDNYLLADLVISKNNGLNIMQ